MTITGRCPIDTGQIEARWNGGAWTVIATPIGGSYSGTLSNLAVGQGMLEVRMASDIAVSARTTNVGIGDVYLCAGQSNMSGSGSNNQGYSHATLKSGLFGNNYGWAELVDPYDGSSGQIDTVSSDSFSPHGSFIPLLATLLMQTNGVPVAFVPSAKAGTSISVWQPGANHQDRTTLYGSMVYRALQVGGVKAVLWWQGESDVSGGMTQATYNSNLDTIANTIGSDLGVKLIPAKLQNITGNEAVINAAIADAWADNANVTPGPDLNTVANDGLHVVSDAALLDAAQRWATILLALP
jgi:sialate O-acetylesterase